MLEKLLQNEPLTAAEWTQLEASILANQPRATTFGITSENVADQVRLRADLLQAVYPAFSVLCQALWGTDRQRATENSSPWQPLWDVWLPMALQLAARRRVAGRPIVQGILGGQGTGKTTLGTILTLILAHLGDRAVSLSLDDLYKPYAERQHLQQQDPRLIWRGPPGTHDVALGIQVLDHVRQGRTPVLIPRFDKSLQGGAGDRVAAEPVHAIDILLFEGWFVGARPIDPARFETAPPPIITESNRAFARDMNARLQDYQPLWERLDALWVLTVADYSLSKQWRKQAERQMKAGGKPGMDDAEIDAFVEYFWQALHPELFLLPAVNWADLVIHINPDHTPGSVFAGAIAR